MPVANLSELSELTGGNVSGDASTRVHNALPLQNADATCITLVDNIKHTEQLATTDAAAVVVSDVEHAANTPALIVDDPHAAFIKIISFFRPQTVTIKPGVDCTATVAGSSIIGSGTSIRSNVVIGENCRIGQRCILHAGAQLMDNVCIGDDCILYPNTTLYPGTRLGDRVILHASVVLGADGFGYRQEGNKHVKSAQLGWTELGDDVEVGVGTTIDRGAYGPTKIGEGTKIDNQVQIGHNCQIGRHNLICAQVGIAGSVKTGDYVILAGQVGIADHITLHDGVIAGAQCGIMHDVGEKEVVVGSPAGNSKRVMMELAHLAKLPAMRKEMRTMQKTLSSLQERIAGAACKDAA